MSSPEVEAALERLLKYYKTVVKKAYPEANIKQHSKGCPCEVCEAERALGKRDDKSGEAI